MKPSLKNTILVYNKNLFDLIDLRKIDYEENDDYLLRQSKIYEDNVLELEKAKVFIETSVNYSIQINRIKNNLYYNVYNVNPNLYKIIFKYPRLKTKEITIFISNNGEVEYSELKKLEFAIGKPCVENITIEELFYILYKLSLENIINVDLTSIRTSIEINRLNKKLNDDMFNMLVSSETSKVKKIKMS